MTYKFEQFNVQIVNPTIAINLNTITDKAIDGAVKYSEKYEDLFFKHFLNQITTD